MSAGEQLSWTPERLQTLRHRAGFDSQRKLARASTVDPTTIARIESGGNLSMETANKLAAHLRINPMVLFVAHNLAVTTSQLVIGYISLHEAKKDRNYIEHMLANLLTPGLALPSDQFNACQATLTQLNDVIQAFNNFAHGHAGQWPGASEILLERQSIDVSGAIVTSIIPPTTSDPQALPVT